MKLNKVEELSHVKEALHNCGYGEWTVFRARPKEKRAADSQEIIGKKIFTTLPYVEGLSEKLKRAFASAGVSTSFKPLTTLRKVLVSPKDKTALGKQSGVIYSIKCKDCDSLYIGESGRKLEKRLAEHKSKAAGSKLAIREHIERCSKGHNIDWENVKVLEREPKDFPRKILEAIHIRTLNQKLNRDKVLELDPVWDDL